MVFHDNESNLIEMLQMASTSSVYLVTGEKSCANAFELVYKSKNWDKWINSSGKADPPPDFYCDEFRSMMEVMRIDDHSHKNRKGKLVNPTYAKERELEKELRNSGIMNNFPQAQLIITTATDLPTDADHNYTFYKKNFIRILKDHINSIELYKQNHAGYQMIFYIFDESSAYYVDNTAPMKSPHFWFADKSLLEIVENSQIDYLIWHTPYKQLLHMDQGKRKWVDLPEVCVFNVSEISSIRQISYDDNCLVSGEN